MGSDHPSKHTRIYSDCIIETLSNQDNQNTFQIDQRLSSDTEALAMSWWVPWANGNSGEVGESATSLHDIAFKSTLHLGLRFGIFATSTARHACEQQKK